MVVVDGYGIPIGSTLASAFPAEVTLAEETLETVKVPRNGRGRPKKRPLRLNADKGYDSDPLRKKLKEFKIDLIFPHRKNRKRPKKQDGRKLRRYRKRWKIERTFS
jgi:IS5 family transposase